ncbi:hypothetical protein DOS81_04490 [Staphylococcus felis]|uniref:Rib/alpha-like domain-containing protein n=1 Tax=Staphylococcus felis TaxID=46127 RepID=UPI000E253CAC|nr:Rib/alpha-like domain-containing protein [Staphylococcus felis]REI30418.1 hypothetical protein DOS81_04490 [Staphylococcus felis]
MKVTVTPNQAQENTPGYEDGNTTPGNPRTLPTSDAADVPPGTKLGAHPVKNTEGWTATADPDNRTVTVTPQADSVQGTILKNPDHVPYPEGDTAH